jgi:hypothetical protein
MYDTVQSCIPVSTDYDDNNDNTNNNNNNSNNNIYVHPFLANAAPFYELFPVVRRKNMTKKIILLR